MEPFARLLDRHRGKTCRSGAAQRLQEEGLGLVAPVVGEQQQVDAGLGAHRAERGVALLARPGFDALRRRRPRDQSCVAELDGQALSGPGGTLRRALREPLIRLRAEPVMNMQRDHTHTKLLRRMGASMEQGGGVATAAVGNGEV